MIIGRDEIQERARIACHRKGRLVRWELVVGDGEEPRLIVFYAKRFARDGDEIAIEVPLRPGVEEG